MNWRFFLRCGLIGDKLSKYIAFHNELLAFSHIYDREDAIEIISMTILAK